MGLASTRLAEQRASGARGGAHDGMGSHHGRNHSLQHLLLPHGGVDGAQPTATGGDQAERFLEEPGAMDFGR